jgi:hypothetical protein
MIPEEQKGYSTRVKRRITRPPQNDIGVLAEQFLFRAYHRIYEVRFLREAGGSSRQAQSISVLALLSLVRIAQFQPTSGIIGLIVVTSGLPLFTETTNKWSFQK